MKRETLLKKTIPELKKIAWTHFSKYIRNRDGYCFTCGSRNGIQAGHLFHNKGNTYFNEKNVHSQCSRCNLYLSGNLGEYTYRFIKKYGEKEYLKLKRQSNIPKKWKKNELIDIIEKYKELNNEKCRAKNVY